MAKSLLSLFVLVIPSFRAPIFSLLPLRFVLAQQSLPSPPESVLFLRDEHAEGREGRDARVRGDEPPRYTTESGQKWQCTRNYDHRLEADSAERRRASVYSANE